MPDTRSPDDMVAMLVVLQAKIDALESTVMPRLARRPTGDIEPTVLTVPKTNTLLLNGQTVARATYPVLWQWVQDNGLIITNLFTNGDGSTTFGIPNFVGKVVVGSGTLGGDVYPHGSVAGSTTRSISISNMPNHDHNVTNSLSHSGHSHAIFGDGNHGGHFPGSSFTAAAGSDLGLAAWNSGGSGNGNHGHGMSIESPGNHTINESAVGGGIPLDIRQISIAINWLIYT